MAEVRIINLVLKEAFGKGSYLGWWVDNKLFVLLFSLSVFLKHLIRREVFHCIYFCTIKNRIGFQQYSTKIYVSLILSQLKYA